MKEVENRLNPVIIHNIRYFPSGAVAGAARGQIMVLRTRIPAVVIAEDEKLRESVRYNLFLEGFEVATASRGGAGLALVSTNPPEVVLLGCSDWAEIVAKLKQDVRTRNIPAIVFTASETIGEVEKALSLGADECIGKSFKAEMLGKIVREKLKKCQAQIKKAQKIKRIPMVVIDDDAGLRRVVEFNLTRDGFEVHGAEDGRSGIELVRKIKPKLVLLDIVMPGMDGLEVLSALKYDAKTADIPVIMLTTESAIGTIDRAYEIGAVDYITKPIRGRKLGETLKEKLKLLRSSRR
jgi:DNA-binding response OmpR family regulator